MSAFTTKRPGAGAGKRTQGARAKNDPTIMLPTGEATREEAPPASDRPSSPTKTKDRDTTRYVSIGPRRVVAVLVCVEGKLLNRTYPVLNGENALGRRVIPGNPAGLFDEDDGSISRAHGTLDWLDGRLLLRALKPIELNGAPVDDEGEIVSHGDEIVLGESRFVLVSVPPRPN